VSDNRENGRFPLLYLIVLAVVVVFLVFKVTEAGDEEEIIEQHVTTGGDSSVGLGFGGTQFDVDIAQCVGSVVDSWFIFYSKQRLQENYWCHAITLANAGYIEAAEYMLCQHTVLSEMPDCPGKVLDRMALPVAEGSSGPADAVAEAVEELEEHARQQFDSYQMQITDLKIELEHSRQQSINAYSRQTQLQQQRAQKLLEQLPEQSADGN